MLSHDKQAIEVDDALRPAKLDEKKKSLIYYTYDQMLSHKQAIEFVDGLRSAKLDKKKII
jgi:hypothetical protein